MSGGNTLDKHATINNIYVSKNLCDIHLLFSLAVDMVSCQNGWFFSIEKIQIFQLLGFFKNSYNS